MAKGSYDIITVGGGLGGTALAKAMAEQGARVLVVEQERHFRDRVRGEWMAPWGTAEARALGIYELLCETGGHEVPGLAVYLESRQIDQRDLATTTPQRGPALAFYHPQMQEAVLAAAAAAGAEIRRGARVREVKPAARPTVVVEQDGHSEEVQGRLVVGADGRTSTMRKWGRFEVRRDPQRLFISGVLFDDVPIPPETSYQVIKPGAQLAYLFPQGRGRVRAYFVCRQDAQLRLQGEEAVPRFVEECLKAGAAAEWYARAKPIGPLATFDAADTWVEHPYKEGVALIGDAAASSDPTWGQGLSLTLRDVRVLRDHLLSQQDWEAAGQAYAAEHDRHYGVIHTVENWQTEFFLETGVEAEARRARALPLIAQDMARIPDHLFSGPDLPADETVRRRFFGEE